MNRFAPQALWTNRRLRWSAAVVLGAIILIGAATAGVLAHVRTGNPAGGSGVAQPSTCSDAYRLLKLSPSQISAANPVCLTQSLELSGEISGSVAQGYTVDPNGIAPTQMCSVPKRWSGLPPAVLAFAAGGKAFRLRISTPGTSEHQAVMINDVANVVELASMSDPSQDWNQASGTLNVNADGVTGSLDVKLLRDVGGAQPVHLIGRWACGAPLSTPTADASVPCSSFYALNQLTDAEVARLKTSGCNAQNLTFSGDLSATVDHAVTDLAFPANDVLHQDNLCGQAYGTFDATLKFSVGGETFQLHLQAFGSPSVGRGQFSAEGPGLAPGVVLHLGVADPAKNGLFVSDQEVEWDGTAGAFTIAADMKSGTIDATVTGQTNGSTVQVKGSWRCAA